MENTYFDNTSALYEETVENSSTLEDNLEDSPSTQNSDMTAQILSLFTNPDFVNTVAKNIKDTLVSNHETEEERGSSTSKISIASSSQLTMPTFHIPIIDNSDKLQGHSNYRSWKQRFQREIMALGRSEFLLYPLGGSLSHLTDKEKKMYDAQVRQYLDASLHSGPKSLIANESTAAGAFSKLEQMYGKNNIQQMMELLDNFGNINLQPKMNPVTFVSRFESAVQQFHELGAPLDRKLVVAYFLHKVRLIPSFMGFYSTIVSLPEETRNYDFVRKTFLDVARNNQAIEMNKSKWIKNDRDIVVCYECNIDSVSRTKGSDIITICSFCLDSPEVNDSINNISVSVTCQKCKKSSANNCDFCLGVRMEESSGEPPRKKVRPSSSSTGLSFPYTKEQFEKLKRMTPEEKKSSRCKNCGLLFHRAKDCKNEGRHCFHCHRKGHERKDCRRLKLAQSSDKLKVEIKDDGHYDEANALVLPSKKRKTKVKKLTAEPVRILSKKQRKLLEKVVEKKQKKANRQNVLEELQKYQLSKEEQDKLVSLSSVQTKGLKRMHLEEKYGESQPKKQKFETEEEKVDIEDSKISLSEPTKKTIVVAKKQYDPSHLGFSDVELTDSDPSDDEIAIKKEDTATIEENTTSNTKFDDVAKENDGEVQLVSETKPKAAAIKKETTPAVYVDVFRDPKIQEQRMKLPILAEEQTIMEVINSNPIVIISGETGSGKTTQVPQFLYEAGYTKDKQIGITEPRRIAAISMAERVAKEMNLDSREVSHLVRFQGNVTEDTKIKFMTDGVLLKEMENDFLLNKYSVIILDEAHERTLYTDLLLGFLIWTMKLREKRNIPLKIIIMSATMRIEDFTKNKRLFPVTPPVINVESRQFPVTVHFNRVTDEDYMKAALDKTIKIHSTLPEGGILIFVTGKKEVEQLVNKLRKKFPFDGSKKKMKTVMEKDEEECKTKKGKKHKTKKVVVPHINLNDYSLPRDSEITDSEEEISDLESEDEETVCHDQPLWVLPLYSNLAIDKQNRIFQAVPSGCRLCVVSTNVAETSLTIPGIKYVVDTGKTKAKLYDKVTGVSTFRIIWTSKASANQRAGRAGRTGPGHCYRLFSSAVYNDVFASHEEPEIRRAPLDDVALRMKNMGITSLKNFPFLTAPDLLQLNVAEDRLKTLGLLDERTGAITKLGKKVAKFPISPRFGKMLALSFQQDNLVPYIVMLVATLSVPQILLDGSGEMVDGRSEAERLTAVRKKWTGSGNLHLLGDSMELMSAMAEAEGAYAKGRLEEFCIENGVNHKALIEARKLRMQLTNEINMILPEAELVIDPKLSPPTDHQAKLIRQTLLLGLGDQIARKIRLDEVPTGEKKSKYKYAYRVGSLEDIVYLRKSCVLRRTIPEYVVYQELYETKEVIYMRGVTAVDVEWLPLYFPQLCQIKNPEQASFIDGKVACHIDGTFGVQAWPLKGVKMEYPETEQAYRWFAKFLLEGEVVEKLKKYTSNLLSQPAMMVKKYGMLQPRTNTITQALMSKKIRRKDSLIRLWKECPGYLLNEYLQWVPQSCRTEVTGMWPPL